MEQRRCYGCMNCIEELVCPHCGYDNSKGNEGHQLAVGTVLREQYLIGKVLGQGGFGITYLGWDLFLEMPIAIKEYYPNGLVLRETEVSMNVTGYGGEEGIRFQKNKERFMREAKMLARFSDVPQIVQVKNFFPSNNTAYIVMEYVEGVTLKEYVLQQGGRLSWQETLAIIKPIMEALGKVHTSGLVHRDISPDNIMLLPNGNAKLLDFGAVRDVSNAEVDKPLTKSTEAILKYGYAPIEQYQSRGSLGPWTDVYALCAVMYYCLTGQVPPDAPERLLGEPEIDFAGKIPELPKHVVQALRKGMMLRAADRTGSMEELYRNLCEAQVISARDKLGRAQGIGSINELGRAQGIGSINELGRAQGIGSINELGRAQGIEPIDELGRTQGIDPIDILGKTQGIEQIEVLNKPHGTDSENIVEKPKTSKKTDVFGQPVETDTLKKHFEKFFIERKIPMWAVAVIVIVVIFLCITVIPNVGSENNSDAKNEQTSDVEGNQNTGAVSGETQNDTKATGQCGNSIVWTLENGILTLDGIGETWYYNLSQEEIEKEKEYTAEACLKAEMPEWYVYRKEIQKIVISGEIDTLNNGLFCDMPNLKEVDFGSVWTIDGRVFANCGLEEVVFPEDFMWLYGEVFENCTSLEKVTFLDTSTVDDQAFVGCTNLKEIYFNEDAEMELSEDNLWNPKNRDRERASETVVFYVYEGSPAEMYAKENQVDYIRYEMTDD